MTSKSSDEILAECVASMGAELGDLFQLLGNELTRLYGRWHEYLFLYGGPQHRLDLMNSAASFFFSVVQQSLWHETLLGISRLAGPASTDAEESPPVRRIVALIRDRGLREKVSALVEDAIERGASAVELLNRRITRGEPEVAFATDAMPPGSASHEQIKAALGSLARLLNTIQRHFQGSTTAYDFSASPYGAERLLCVVRDGLRREEIRQKEPGSRQAGIDDRHEHTPAIGGASIDSSRPRLQIVR